MTLGDKLSKLRKENNYTQEQLADVLGVSRQAISKWESNITYPETDKLVRMSKLFHCTTDYLLLDEDEMDTDEEQNISEYHAALTNQIFIESPLTKNLVSCFKVTASPVLLPTKNNQNICCSALIRLRFLENTQHSLDGMKMKMIFREKFQRSHLPFVMEKVVIL